MAFLSHLVRYRPTAPTTPATAINDVRSAYESVPMCWVHTYVVYLFINCIDLLEFIGQNGG